MSSKGAITGVPTDKISIEDWVLYMAYVIDLLTDYKYKARAELIKLDPENEVIWESPCNIRDMEILTESIKKVKPEIYQASGKSIYTMRQEVVEHLFGKPHADTLEPKENETPEEELKRLQQKLLKKQGKPTNVVVGGKGICYTCEGTGRVGHVCNSFSTLRDDVHASNQRHNEGIMYQACTTCGEIRKVRYQWHTGSGSDSIFLDVGDSNRGYTFPIEEALEILRNKVGEELPNTVEKVKNTG